MLLPTDSSISDAIHTDSDNIHGNLESFDVVGGFALGDYPIFEHSKGAVARAGETLKGHLILSKENRSQILNVFDIANNWRESHLRPMDKVRRSVVGKVSAGNLNGITVARLKTMPSIRKKLRRHKGRLDRVQDLAGVRTILPSLEQAESAVEFFKQDFRYRLVKEDNYIENPKKGGYRSFHLIYKFLEDGVTDEVHGRLVEVQLRSRLQHAWATAVEASGLINQQDMKAGEGDERWLRLFDLVSAEFAVTEQAPVSEHVPSDQSARVREIIELEKELNAANVLDDLRYVSGSLDNLVREKNKASYYLLEYDHVNRLIDTKPKFQPISALREYNKREIDNVISENEEKKTVLVEADSVENLKKAYPNYFTDVGYFTGSLRQIVEGRPIEEYRLPPVHKVSVPRDKPVPDTTWMRGGIRKMTEGNLLGRAFKGRKNKT